MEDPALANQKSSRNVFGADNDADQLAQTQADLEART